MDNIINHLQKYDIDLLNKTILSERVKKALEKVSPDKIYIFNNKPIVLFFENPNQDEKKEIFKKCWNFGEAPIIIIKSETDFEIYNGFDYILENGEFKLEPLDIKGLNYLSLMSGRYFTDDKFKQNNKRVDKVLLENIKYARKKIIDTFESNNIKLIQTIANSLIGRIIFIRYLIDREVTLNFENNKKTLTNDELKDILDSKDTTYKLFKYLKSDKGFNGDWFPISSEEEHLVTQEHLTILKNLISGTEIKTGQGSLFDFYDFSIIPIEFISNIYESFIGEEQQKKDGAYYTPTFLVDYILKYTVDDYFKNNPTEYNCKVLDPACGSGIFLVETLRKLVAQYEKVNNKPISADELKKLVRDNIYAIDYNKDALAISVFSLYITMLDYQNPKEIESFKFPHLLKSEKNPNPNFFEDDFFDIEAPYNRLLKGKKIDFIVGNPPYGRSSIKKGSLADKYIKLNEIEIGNEDIVQAFMIRVKDLVAQNTKISFIVTSKVLYNLQTRKFRMEHFFNKFKVNHILELSSVCREIFENADVPVSILFYKYSTKEEVLNNDINYISMKPSPYFEKLKVLLLTKSDFKKVNQSKLLENDYLWKILVYGSYLDFYFIKRLKKYTTIDDNIKSKAQGLIVGGGDQNSTLEYIGMPYIQTKQFRPLYILENKITWEKKFVHRNKSLELFKAPALLISKGISIELDFKIGVLQRDSIFADFITTVKTTNKNILYEIMGILSSSFFKYFIINTASSIGIERPQIHNPEKFGLPYIKNSKIIQSAKDIEEYSKDDFAQYDKEFDDLKEKLNDNVLKAFELNEQEYALVNYANSIMIPWIMQKNYDIAFKPYEYNNKEDRERLEEYANITIKKNQELYEKMGKFFQATILWDRYTIGVYYKVLDKASNQQIIWKKESNIKNFLKFTNGQPLENLFIQKDIKGFESDGYYVIKPNEYKNWHKAIGYLDFYEFEKAILDAGRGA